MSPSYLTVFMLSTIAKHPLFMNLWMFVVFPPLCWLFKLYFKCFMIYWWNLLFLQTALLNLSSTDSQPNDETVRRVERGSRIVTVVPQDAKLVLQVSSGTVRMSRKESLQWLWHSLQKEQCQWWLNNNWQWTKIQSAEILVGLDYYLE